MRHRAVIARMLLLGTALTGASCEALFGGLSQSNPASCVANMQLCTEPDTICNQLTRECEPALRIDSLSPKAAPYDQEVLLTIKGKNFVEGMTLTIGGKPATKLTVVSNSQITAMAPAQSGTKQAMEVQLTAPSGQVLLAGKLFHYYPFPQFAPVIQISSPSTVRMLRSADFNQDGRPDLAQSADAATPVAIFLGQQDGTLRQIAPIAFSARPISMAVGDVNNDGKPDVVVTESGPQPVVEVALGTGDGTFTVVGSLQVPVTVGGLALLDVNSDKNADLVLGNGANLSVYPSLGTGMFGTPKQFPHTLQLLDASSQITTGDMNGDGRSDIILTSGKDTRLGVFLNQGNGSLGSSFYSISQRSLLTPVAADLNHDGLLDVVSSVSGATELQLFWGDGTGNTVAGQRFDSFSSDECCGVADLNGDGTNDIVALDYNAAAERFEVHAGDGGGVFTRSANYPLESFALARSIYVGDLTADGKPDVVIAQRTGKLSLFKNVTP
ncbi:MAG: FG-GAP-like repeat-containing protein [Polyangia bacterium]